MNPTILLSALKAQDVEMAIATIHNDREDEDCVWGLLEEIDLGIMFTSDRLVDLNRIGSIIQPSISEQNSDCLEDRHCINTVHSVAAPADLVIGSMSENCGFHMVRLTLYVKALSRRHSAELKFYSQDARTDFEASSVLGSRLMSTPLMDHLKLEDKPEEIRR
ncbi:hypothetical protein G7Z17_g12164 [Cylindrodendrum hubeiense]|uniref:Uncharacterized protein n=1 Tax=Cylindrodendrum hubeiense TaxID=595255 RepID=A0A9P5H1G8_9HYPO|nr:hypothetical protein G7Z17_g12164 [Cylindrodendrum hubeiense]